MPPPSRILPVINHVVAVYKIWHEYKKNYSKDLRYTLGEKIDSIFITILEYLFVASYQNKQDKLSTLTFALKRTDLLKFFIRVSWELKALDNKKYIFISEKLDEFGRMIGGWKKGLESKTPPAKAEGELF